MTIEELMYSTVDHYGLESYDESLSAVLGRINNEGTVKKTAVNYVTSFRNDQKPTRTIRRSK